MRIGIVLAGLLLISSFGLISTASTDAQARGSYRAFGCMYHSDWLPPVQYTIVYGKKTPCPAPPAHIHSSHLNVTPIVEYSGPECIIREPFD